MTTDVQSVNKPATADTTRQYGKLNPAKVLELRAKNGLTMQQIATLFGASKTAVCDCLQDFNYLFEMSEKHGLEAYREQRLNWIDSLQAKILAELSKPKRFATASIQQLVWAFGVLYDKGRLESGKSTQNLSVYQQMSDKDRESLNHLAEALSGQIAGGGDVIEVKPVDANALPAAASQLDPQDTLTRQISEALQNPDDAACDPPD